MQLSSFHEHFSLREYLIAVSAVLITVFLLSSLFPRWRFYRKYKNLPPGPFCWPVIGYAPFFNVKTAHLSLKRAADKYGGMFGIFVGKRYALVIDDFEILKEAFKREEFCGRELGLVHNLSDTLSKCVTFLSGGSAWHEQRRIWNHAIPNLLSKSALHSELQSQIVLLNEAVEKTAGKDVNLDVLFEDYVVNAASYMIFGKTYESGNKLLGQHIKYVESFLFYIAGTVFKTMFHKIGILISLLPFFRRAKRVVFEEENWIRDVIFNRLKSMDQNDPQTFIDYFHTEMKKTEQEEKKIVDSVIGNCEMFLTQFVDGLSISMKWLLLLLASHPEIQRKIQLEIDCISEQRKDSPPTEKFKTPLLGACMMESMRLKYLMTMSPLKRVSKDTELRGYDIPKDTMVIFNIWSHFNNPKLWTDPERFNPYRFLSEDGKSLHVPEEYIPFSYGVRTCLGERVVNAMLYTFVGSILQRFQILPPEAGVNLNVNAFFAQKPKFPVVKFQKRLNTEL